MTVAAIGTALAFADPPGWLQPTIAEWVILGVTGVAGFLAIVNTQPPRSSADYHDTILSGPRLRFGRVLAIFTLVVGVVYLGGPVVPNLTPVWAAIAAVMVMHYYRLVQARRNAQGR
jgi:drug/metabolite transporter (DMT)-like permease